MAHIKQGFDTNPVSCQKQPLPVFLPDAEGENAVEPGKAPFPELGVGVQHHLRVGIAQEGMSGFFQLLSDFLCIVEFAVVDDGIFFSCPGQVHGLLSALRIPDNQPGMEHNCLCGFVNSFRIRPTAVHGLEHGAQGFLVCR